MNSYHHKNSNSKHEEKKKTKTEMKEYLVSDIPQRASLSLSRRWHCGAFAESGRVSVKEYEFK